MSRVCLLSISMRVVGLVLLVGLIVLLVRLMGLGPVGVLYVVSVLWGRFLMLVWGDVRLVWIIVWCVAMAIAVRLAP